MYVNII